MADKATATPAPGQSAATRAEAPGPSSKAISAPFALGIIAGVIAALTILPASFVLLVELSSYQQHYATSRAVTGANIVARMLAEGRPIPRDEAASLELSHLEILMLDEAARAGRPSTLFAEEQTELQRLACGSGLQPIHFNDAPSIAACVTSDSARVVAVAAVPPLSTWRIAAPTLLLALIAGLVTALGVQRALTPITVLQHGLERIGLGERGVRVQRTGFTELDAIVDRVNLAARAMEQREEAILARIRVVQELARVVAHEIRNPLQSLELLSTLVRDESDPIERGTLVTAIQDEVRLLEQVVKRILDEGASEGALRLQRTQRPLRPLAEQICSLARPLLSRDGVELQTSGAGEFEIAVDVTLFRRALENLIQNAAREVPRPGGLIRVTCESQPEGTTILVDDNGPGIPAQLGNRIYELDVSGHKSTGIGLGLARGIIHAHSGRLHHEVSPLGGARFVAYLPSAPPTPRSTDA